MKDYDLDFMIETFSRHEKEYEKSRKKDSEQFKKDYPNDPLPAWYSDPFSIATALKCICMEIAELKDKK